MQVHFGIEIVEPKKGDQLFPPQIRFQLSMLNVSAICLTDQEIDEQIRYLQVEVEKLAKQAKKKLKAAKKRHDALLEELRDSRSQ